MITVFLADDHAIIRDGLKALLDVQTDIEVVGIANNGREAVANVTRLQPDVVILDISMPELNGIDAAEQIAAACPDSRIIMLSMYDTAQYIKRALNTGAFGYLLKESAGVEVLDAVRTVYVGKRYFSQKISETVIEQFAQQESGHGQKDPLQRLSTREREVLQLVVEGNSSAQIAELLVLSPKTVDTYRSRLMSKLEIDNLPDLVKFAIQHGVTNLE
jgi:DNA-binding NarL/FixJ family response regulator